MAGFSFGTPTTSAPPFSLGSNQAAGGTSGFNFGAAAPSATAPTTLQFNAPAPVSGGVTYGTPAPTGGSGFTFGSSGGLSMGTPATTQATTLSFKPGTLGGGLNFGSPSNTQQSTLGFVNPAASTAPTGLTFGSTPATNQQTLSFGSTPATSQALSFGSNPATTQTLSFGTNPTSQPLSFGSNPATSQPLSFGSSPATTQPLTFGSNPATSQPLSFGSNPATSQTLSFGSTPATTQPTLNFVSTPNTSQPLSFGSTLGTTQTTLGFGSTPASTQAGLTFGSTPALTQGGLSFGSAPPSTQTGLTFGSTPASTQAGLTFGSASALTQGGLNFGTPPTSQPTLNFGLSTPVTTASTGFSLGAPASTASGLSFGLGSQAVTAKPAVSFGITASTTTAPTLLNFSTPKTTASTGFSLSVSAGTGTFTLPSTTAPPTTAPAVFKGLGGVDPSTTQGSGQKDAKSVKENIVNAEIMQTLDAFKNFVKQQKNLSCEVSRAPVKPMHKVTEDTDALQKLLISVSSALQKNRVIANKLKSDTTKCLSLCEMAQRTHDTPPGLQNDNVAPLEFFIQLVSKFERDIQVLRQEIDNTEKHVNSLSYPAILTPQELSEALRRLHDSFIALAGRLQTAHAGVIAQKERHLSLRRHFLKDHTNIFENSSSTASTIKKTRCYTLPMPGPTPFSSMGGIPNINLMAGQDKPVTFSTGPTNLSGWGSSTISSLNTTPASGFLQPSGTIGLSSPQAVDNQNFQLGKPPPGNKRGKR